MYLCVHFFDFSIQKQNVMLIHGIDYNQINNTVIATLDLEYEGKNCVFELSKDNFDFDFYNRFVGKRILT